MLIYRGTDTVEQKEIDEMSLKLIKQRCEEVIETLTEHAVSFREAHGKEDTYRDCAEMGIRALLTYLLKYGMIDESFIPDGYELKEDKEKDAN